MSIWCSWPTIGFDGWDDEPQPRGGQVRSYATGWSNHYPTTDDGVEQPASVDLAHIAPWCVPGWSDDELSLDLEVGPWLRLSLDSCETTTKEPVEVVSDVHASVVMDEAAVVALRDALTEWIETEKVQPK